MEKCRKLHRATSMIFRRPKGYRCNTETEGNVVEGSVRKVRYDRWFTQSRTYRAMNSLRKMSKSDAMTAFASQRLGKLLRFQYRNLASLTISAHSVHKPVPHDRKEPGHKMSVGIVGGPNCMHRQEYVLNEVFDVLDIEKRGLAFRSGANPEESPSCMRRVKTSGADEVIGSSLRDGQCVFQEG